MLKKSVISLISYDAHMLPESIKSYYPYVDEIVLGLDENRISWSNNPFTFEEGALWSALKEIDKEDKIVLIEDNFHKNSVAIENDNYERNLLRSKCSYPWIFSIDADETLINAKEFFYKWCPIVEPYYQKLDIAFTWFLPFKEFEDCYLMIANQDNRWFKGDTQGFGTSKDTTYTYCRWTNQKRVVLSPLAVMHWSFCRRKEDLSMKLNNFGHSDKTSGDPFFHNWDFCTLDNYHLLTNFKTSGFGNNQWEKLIKVPKQDLWPCANMEAKMVYV